MGANNDNEPAEKQDERDSASVPQAEGRPRAATKGSRISDWERDRYPGGWRVGLVMVGIYMMAILINLVSPH